MDLQSPLDDGMQQSDPGVLPVEVEVVEYWKETTPWIRVLAALLGLYFVWTFRNIIVYSGFTLADNPGESAGFGFGVFLMAAPCTYLVYCFFRFAILLRRAASGGDQAAAESSFPPLRHAFIVLLVLLALSFVAVAVGIFTALTAETDHNPYLDL